MDNSYLSFLDYITQTNERLMLLQLSIKEKRDMLNEDDWELLRGLHEHYYQTVEEEPITNAELKRYVKKAKRREQRRKN